MSKISDESVRAFMNAESFCRDNTCVTVNEEGTSHLTLHNNQIAKRTDSGDIYINDGGWHTKTTSSRLNAIPGLTLKQKKGGWILNGKVWDGSSILVE